MIKQKAREWKQPIHGPKRVKRNRASLKFLVMLIIGQMLSIGLIACAPVSLKTSNTLPDPRNLLYPSLQFNFPKVERRQLKNGMVVYLLPDHEIPIVNVSVLCRTGSIYEPSDKVGLAGLTGEVMRTGGTKSFSAEKLDEELAFHSINLNTSIGRESGSASLSLLTKDLDKGLALFFEVIKNPVFHPEKVELAKEKKIEKIRRKNDSPQKIAFREFRKLLYKGDPRGNEATIAGVQKLTREDMVWFHERYFHPDNMIFGLSGDFQKEEMIAKLEKLTAEWAPLPEPLPPAPVPQRSEVKSINLIAKKIPQSIIVLGGFSLPKGHPDYFTFSILNDILGGSGFNSYLTEEIRSDRGLAYSVGSFYSDYKDYGVFGAYCFTGSSNTYVATSLMYRIIEQVKSGRISSQKLQWAKDSILNQFVFSFSSSHGLVGQMLSLEYNGLPRDYLDTYRENISKVNLADVQRVAGEYLKPEKYILLVLGDEENFDQPVTGFGGPVKRINIENY